MRSQMLTISIRFISKLIGKQASEKGVSDIFGKIGSRMRAYCPYARVVNLRAGPDCPARPGPAKFVKPVIYNPVQDLPHHLPIILETVTLREELLEEKKPTRMNFRR